MAEVQYNWPAAKESTTIGKRVARIDGLEKSTGEAKYTYDINLKNQLIAKGLGCPHGHAKFTGINVAAANKVPGVVHVEVLKQAGDEIQWAGDLVAVVAAENEASAAEGVAALVAKYEVLDIFTAEENLEAAEAAGRTSKGGGKPVTQREPGDDDDEDEFIEAEIERLLKESKFTVAAQYGIDAITHCCLEPHGSTCEWQGNKLKAYLSTQNVSRTDEGFAAGLNITGDDVDVECQYIGGGFGSKFAADYWGVACAKIAKETGRPVKFMLDRDQELKIAGNRPSGYIDVRLGADENGVIQVWDSHHWGSAGFSGGGVSHGVIPYVIEPKNYRRKQTAIKINADRARAWRAPNHPQACAISQTAVDDLAAAMGKDSYDVFKANLDLASNGMGAVYAAEMEIAAKAMDWKAKWHPHGKGEKNGSVVEGLGMAIHTWGGTANSSSCQLKIHPDGGVESYCGTQELGTGTRTACAMIVAETLGLGVNQVKVHIGSSQYPFSGASGGSTTIGAVSESHRRASQDALAQLFEKVAPKLGGDATKLVAANGKIIHVDDDTKSITWKQACSTLGMQPLEVTSQYQRGQPSTLSNSGVAGVQMAHVAVDRETGVVKMKKFVAVQDMGLIINRLTAESQMYGAVIMGIAYALYEHRILDPVSGDFVNANLADYHLPRLGDIGEIVIELYEPEDQRQRGVIGLGEPPVISPGAAISNAVCNALGTRVPVLPMTPKRVIEAVQQKGRG